MSDNKKLLKSDFFLKNKSASYSDHILMCKDKKVYDLDSEQVYNYELLPGKMKGNPCRDTFRQWLKARYSSGTNSMARKLKGVSFGQGNQVLIDITTYALSLNDCYWLREVGSNKYFDEVTPYLNEFVQEDLKVYSSSIPTLYTPGYLNKRWISWDKLIKFNDTDLLKIELECLKMCKGFGLIDYDSYLTDLDNKLGLIVENFTNEYRMLETAEMSGRFDEDFDSLEIINKMGEQGIYMIIFDAIVGNGDRHWGNFGYMRDTTTGEYLCTAPLYDFDHALDAKGTEDRLTKEAVDIINNINIESVKTKCRELCLYVVEHTTNEIFTRRANYVLDNSNK